MPWSESLPLILPSEYQMHRNTKSSSIFVFFLTMTHNENEQDLPNQFPPNNPVHPGPVPPVFIILAKHNIKMVFPLSLENLYLPSSISDFVWIFFWPLSVVQNPSYFLRWENVCAGKVFFCSICSFLQSVDML